MVRKRANGDELLKDIEDVRLESSLLAYINLISNIALLAPEEVDRLVATMRSRHASPEARQEARDKLVLANTRLVVNIAKQYYQPGIHLMDLISEGTIGLMVAVEKYDPTKGFRLSTYATWWIRQRILRYLINNQYLIRVPEHIIDKISRLNKAAQKFRSSHNREPTVAELAKKTGLSIEDVERYTSSLPSILSLEDGFNGERDDSRTPSLHERVGSGEDIIQHVLDRTEVEQMLQLLDEKERVVICQRYGLGQGDERDAPGSEEGSTLEELAQFLGVSRERVRQIELQALRKIKRRFGRSR